MKAFQEFWRDIAYCLKISWDTSKFYTIFRIVIQIATAMLPLVSIYLVSAILDALVSGLPDVVRIFIILIICYFAVQLLTQWSSKLNTYFMEMHNQMIDNYLNRHIIDKTSSVDLSYFDSPSYYDRIKMMRINTVSINQIVWNIIDLISSSVTFVVAFTVMFQFSPLFSILIALSYLPIALYDQAYVKKLYNWQTRNVGEERKLEYISDLITRKNQAKNIRVFGIAEYLINIYTSTWQAWFSNRKKIVKRWSVRSLFLAAVPEVLTILILVQVGLNIINGINSIGDFSLYSGMIGQVVSSVFIITTMVTRISENKLRVKDFRDFDHWENKVEGSGDLEIEHIEEIEFKDASFTYPGNDSPTIKHLNLRFASKERLAFVGINGAGKSTLVKLLLRFYDVTEGELLVNGVDIRRYSLDSLRKCYSVLFQEYSNFAFTLRENIRLSDINKKYTDEDLLEACREGGAEQIVEGWEEGLDTYLYREFVPDGKELSGGENQKIALSRTFFHKGDLIILDEPSSSIDPESEYELFKRMVELCKDKGLILITHRLSNVVLADRIIVIENGEMIEDGSHAELMKKQGRYATLFQYQAENYIRKANESSDARGKE